MSVEQLTNMCINLVVLEIICSVKSQDYLQFTHHRMCIYICYYFELHFKQKYA